VIAGVTVIIGVSRGSRHTEDRTDQHGGAGGAPSLAPSETCDDVFNFHDGCLLVAFTTEGIFSL
jgi:hypothetical protein